MLLYEIVILAILCFHRFADGEKRYFPKKFSFGVASSSYQIEGAWNVSDKSENIMDHYYHLTNDENGDTACDSYHLYKRDVEMIQDLGVHFYRFSISWSRLLPTGFPDYISKDGLKYYNDLIDSLISRNIQPVITMFHWDLPYNLQRLGGWTNSILTQHFADYAKVLFEKFGDRVKLWVTINEPWTFCYYGYERSDIPPMMNQSAGISIYLCGHNVLKAHAKVYHMYDEIYRSQQKGKISITLNSNWYEPESDSSYDRELSDRSLQFEIGWFANVIYSKEGDYPKIMKERIDKISKLQGYPRSRLPTFTKEEIDYIRGTYDFFGLNHYSTFMVKNDPIEHLKTSYDNDAGLITYFKDEWPDYHSTWQRIVPWGFTKLLKWIREKYGNVEVMVFENGYSDKNGTMDLGRTQYFHLYLNALLDAIDEGSNVTAYTAWTLMDNFEWMFGYSLRYGLYHVDFNHVNKTRTPKVSALFYKNVIKNRSIDVNFHL